MLRLALFLVASLLALGFTSVAAQAQEKKTHLETAELLVKELRPEHNCYAYENLVIKWKGQDGATSYEAHCDCSGFLTLLFEHVYGYTPETFKAWTGHRRPLARVYHDEVEAEHGFKRIKKITEIQPGDILAVKYLDGVKKDTGHVMIVAEAPRPRDATEPIEPATRQWEVVVIDSSKSGHGPDDTRRKPDKTFYNGVGKGTIRLYTNSQGEIVGYTWSTLKKSEYFDQQKHHLVVGRLDVGFKP